MEKVKIFIVGEGQLSHYVGFQFYLFKSATGKSFQILMEDSTGTARGTRPDGRARPCGEGRGMRSVGMPNKTISCCHLVSCSRKEN